MTPIFHPDMLPQEVFNLIQRLVKAFEGECVWIDLGNVDHELTKSCEFLLGNIAVTNSYKEDLGIIAEGYKYKDHVVNSEYTDSYEAWLPTDDKFWFHELIWRRPDDGRVLTGYSRATRHPSGLIVGTVYLRPKNSRLDVISYFLIATICFSLGFICGYFFNG